MKLKRFVDFGKKFDEREKRETSREFLKNIVLKGIFGKKDSERCHHPIKVIMPFKKIGENQYYSEECRDCGKIFAIFKK